MMEKRKEKTQYKTEKKKKEGGSNGNSPLPPLTKSTEKDFFSFMFIFGCGASQHDSCEYSFYGYNVLTLTGE